MFQEVIAIAGGAVPRQPCAAARGGLPAVHRALLVRGHRRHAEEAHGTPQVRTGRHHQRQGRPAQGTAERADVKWGYIYLLFFVAFTPGAICSSHINLHSGMKNSLH